MNLVSLDSGLLISLLDADRAMEGTTELVIRFGNPGERYVFIGVCITNRHSSHKKAGRWAAATRDRMRAERRRTVAVRRHRVVLRWSRLSGRPLARRP